MDPLRPATTDFHHHRVVEVVDCLSDTVVSVAHLSKEQSRSRGHIMLAAAALCLLVFALSFFQAVSTAASNKQARQRHLQAGKPTHSFRPVRLHAATEVIAGASLFAGLALALGFLAARRSSRSAFEAESPADDTEPRFELVKVDQDGARVQVPPAMTLAYSGPDGERNSEELCASGLAFLSEEGWLTMKLPESGKLSLAQGHRAYFVNWTPRPMAGLLTGTRGLDARFGAYLGGAAAAALLVIGLLEALPIEENTLAGDRFAPSERYIAITSSPLEDAVVEPEMGKDGAEGDTPMAEASGAPGTSGIESATAARASMAIERRSETMTMSKEQRLAVAERSGILGVMASRQIFANANASYDIASGDALQDWHGGFEGGPVGHQVGEVSGSWGNQERGMGQWGIARVGNKLPSLHYGGGDEPCSATVPCAGSGTPSLRRTPKVPVLKVGEVESSNGLDRAIIRRYIKRQKLRITHCYEKRLLVDSELAGTLTARFSIAGSGKVIGSTATGMGDRDLQECVAEVVGSIEFPSTQEGALVNVSYPFTFQPAGG